MTSRDNLLKLSIIVHANSQEEKRVLKAHGLRQLCSTVRPSRPPSPCTGRRRPAAHFHRKQRDEAAKPSCKSAQSWKGKLCTTEVTKTLVIINKDQETASTAGPAREDRRQWGMRWSSAFLTFHCREMPPSEPVPNEPREGHGTALMPKCSE